MTVRQDPPSFRRIAAGDYESRDGRYRLVRLDGVTPPAWNVEMTADDTLLVDGAATRRDAVSLFGSWWDVRQSDIRAFIRTVAR